MRSIENKIFHGIQPLLTWRASYLGKLVFTNGVFDILHRGHVEYLQQAKNMGDYLLVAINSDESVKLLNKGASRPYNSLPNRMRLIAALESVDGVCSFTENTPLTLIQQLHPEVLVKGGDYDMDKLPEGLLVQSYGGTVKSLQFVGGLSTSLLVDKIKNST